jgi:hypothetical protein
MDGITTIEPLTAKAKISDQEMARRRKLVRKAAASNRIEGIYRDPATDNVFESYIRGDIDVMDIGPLLQAQRGPR